MGSISARYISTYELAIPRLFAKLDTVAKVVVDRRVSLVQLVRFLNGISIQVAKIAKVTSTWADCEIV